MFDIFPDTKKVLKNLFVIGLILISSLISWNIKSYIDNNKFSKIEQEIIKEKEVLNEKITSLEKEHIKEVSLLRSEYEKSLKQKVIRETQADGSSKETIETDSNEKKIEVVEKVVEVEKEVIKYVDREVVVEKEVEKVVIVENNLKWSLGVGVQPSLATPYFSRLSLSVGYSITDNFEAFTEYSNSLDFKEPTYSLGLRVRF